MNLVGYAPADGSLISNDEMNQVGMALWIVQHSGLYNMITQAGDAYTAAMCVMALLGNKQVVRTMNSLGEQRSMGRVLARWASDYVRDSVRWQAMAENSPIGPEYVKAIERSIGRFSQPQQEEDKSIRRMMQFSSYHGRPWYDALVTYAEETCYLKGLEARDKMRLRALRGVSQSHLLKAAGAQLL